MRNDTKTRLKHAIGIAARDLAQHEETVRSMQSQGAIGQTYIIGPMDGIDAAIEWAIVREHPDDPDTLLVVPFDDFELVGTPDAWIPRSIVNRPMIARCGESTWINRALLLECGQAVLTGWLPEAATRIIRRKLADLVCGRCRLRIHDLDPEYDNQIDRVRRARAVAERLE